MNEDQLELDLNERDADTRLYVEDLTLNADRVLAKAIGQFEHVFIIGVDDNGASYFSNHADAAFWCLLLDRARHFIMRNAE